VIKASEAEPWKNEEKTRSAQERPIISHTFQKWWRQKKVKTKKLTVG